MLENLKKVTETSQELMKEINENPNFETKENDSEPKDSLKSNE